MQSVYESKRITHTIGGEQAGFVAIAAIFMGLSAAIASITPIAFSIIVVFLFAGPHNWVELRYFISKLPSRFGPFRVFFGSSFAGVLLLGASYAALTLMSRLNLLEPGSIMLYYKFWIMTLHAWLALLVCTRASLAPAQRNLILVVLALTAGGGLMQPLWFGLALVYLHPLVGLAILDRELRRSRPRWVRPYRTILAFLPIVVFLMIIQLSSTASLPIDSALSQQITRHAGSFLMTATSSHMLVSVHTFLEMLHYGVWLLAIPIATSAWQRRRWQPINMPVSRSSTPLQKLLPVVFAASSILVILLWAAFLGDYSATREFYFTVALFHVLAELPFLLWML